MNIYKCKFIYYPELTPGYGAFVLREDGKQIATSRVSYVEKHGRRILVVTEHSVYKNY